MSMHALVKAAQRSIALPRLSSGYAKRFSKLSQSFQCMDCGQFHAKWQGQCNSCFSWNKLEKQDNIQAKNISTRRNRAWTRESKPIKIGDVQVNDTLQRIRLGDSELNLVLGGGIVLGSLTLVAGSPGVGKSTV